MNKIFLIWPLYTVAFYSILFNAKADELNVEDFTRNLRLVSSSELESNNHYESVGQIKYETKNGFFGCSGFVPDFGHNDSSPAYFITVSHAKCSLLIKNNQVFKSNKKIITNAKSPLKVTFGLFADTTSFTATLNVKRILYANFDDMDLSIMQLDATFGHMKSIGTKGLKIVPHSFPGLNKPLHVLGIPLNDLPMSSRFISEYSCQSELPIPLAHNKSQSIIPIAGSHSCLGLQGTSGGPIINMKKEVLGVSIGFLDLDHCTDDGYLCRFNTDGSFGGGKHKGLYQPIEGIQNCFEPKTGAFNLSLKNCLLKTEL